jgi:histone H3/H4
MFFFVYFSNELYRIINSKVNLYKIQPNIIAMVGETESKEQPYTSKELVKEEVSDDVHSDDKNKELPNKRRKIDIDPDLKNFLVDLSNKTDSSVDYLRYLTSLTEQDKTMPLNNVANIMKSVLPPGTKISKEAKQLMQDCCSELISFVTSGATEAVFEDKRKTVLGDDIIQSMYTLGFPNYSEIMTIYLQKYKEFQILRQLTIGIIEQEGQGKRYKKRQENTDESNDSNDAKDGEHEG